MGRYILEEEMKGAQFFVNGDKQILDGYGIETIPRFIGLKK